MIEFDTLKRSNAHYNLQNAFNVAEKELGLTKLLDPEGECLLTDPPPRPSLFSCWDLVLLAERAEGILPKWAL